MISATNRRRGRGWLGAVICATACTVGSGLAAAQQPMDQKLRSIGVGLGEGLDINTEQGVKELRRRIFGGIEVSFSGLARVEATSEDGFVGLTGIGGRGSSAAAAETFYDFRSYLTAEARKGPITLVASVDIAGDDFSDPEGAVFGNGADASSTPGGPAVVRETNWDLRTRHLFLNYKGFADLTIGRQPLKLGNGIAVNTIRDAGKIVKPLGPFAIGGVVVKGGETLPNAVSFDPVGNNDNDLDAYVVFGKYSSPRFAAQLSYGFQDDSRKDAGFPEKRIVNLSVDGFSGDLSYQVEGTYLGGKTPLNAGKGKRLDNDAWQAFAKLQYKWPKYRTSWAVAAGYGTGDNDPNDDKQNDFQSFFMNATGFHIANIYGNDIHAYDSYLPGTPGADGNNAGAGFANTTFVQLSTSKQLTEDLEIGGVATYFVATKKQLVGEGVLLHPNDGTAAPGETLRSDDIGWEADLNLNYRIAKDFSFYARLGYFSPGDIWGRSVPNAKKLQGGLAYTF